MISFWPVSSTVICATPLAASCVLVTKLVSTPSVLKLARDASPRLSAPSFATMATDEPRRPAATAWLAPLPPKSCSKRLPMRVSPGCAMRGALVTRSTFALPTTTTPGIV